MEIPTELQQSIKKANQAAEKAQSDYENMLAKVSNLEAEYTNAFKQNNPTASGVEIYQYLQTALKNCYEKLALEKQSLALEKQILVELLKQHTILLQKDQNQGITSLIRAETAPVTPEQVLKDLLGFDIETSHVNFSRPSVTLNGIPTDEISYIVPLMKFVCREEPTQSLYNTLDNYLDWKKKPLGEPEKKIKFVTVVGTSGKGKTTFARRFIDLEYTGRHSAIINDCRDSNRRYRVSCTKFDYERDAETQLSSLILYEAFKHSSETYILQQDYITAFRCKFQKLSFADVLRLITKTFGFESGPLVHERLLIINLDETNALLESDREKSFFKQLLRILRDASENFTLLTVLSGTHSVELFKEVKISECYFDNIELSMIDIDASQDVVLGMCLDPAKRVISPYLKYLLILCGGIGRYIEITIIQMSIMGAFAMNQEYINGFKLDAFEYFLDHLQDTSRSIEVLLMKVTNDVLSRYCEVFKSYAKLIELLSCYTLFQWNVERNTIIDGSSVCDLEKIGLVFLQYVPQTRQYICTVPFITLYWAINYSNTNISIPFLKDLKSYFSPDESENNTLHIMMAKLWGLSRKDNLRQDILGYCTVQLSELVPLREGQSDIDIKFRPLFTILTSEERIKTRSKWHQSNTKCIAFLNAKGAPFVDSVIVSKPRIGIQEKQGVLDKKRNVDGFKPSTFSDAAFKIERGKFSKSDVFILVTDANAGKIDLGKLDVIIDCSSFAEFAGPLLALRKLFSINELNESVKRTRI